MGLVHGLCGAHWGAVAFVGQYPMFAPVVDVTVGKLAYRRSFVGICHRRGVCFLGSLCVGLVY